MMAAVAAAVTISAAAAFEAQKAGSGARLQLTTINEIENDLKDWLCDWDLIVPHETN